MTKRREDKTRGSKTPRFPRALADFQRWFGAATTRPLRTGDRTEPRGIDGPSLETEARRRLRGTRDGGGLEAVERLAVYNRQYWYRLITILQDTYPCCQHVLGLDAFNAWCVRYLTVHPPASPYLSDLDAEFPDFLRRRLARATRALAVSAEKRTQALQAAAYDRALSRALDAPGAAAVPEGTDLSAARWMRAAHVTPLWLEWDFPAYRARCLADEAGTARIPLRKNGRAGRGVCVHRHEAVLYEKTVSRAEFLLLDALAKPRSLDAVFRAALRGATPRERAAMERNVAEWFRTWVELGWIGPESGEGQGTQDD